MPADVEFDFEARVHFPGPEEGGRKTPPRSGYRCDFRYKDHRRDDYFMIWPLEFFTEDGPIPYGEEAPWNCWARFFIFDREFTKSIHKSILQPGVEFEMSETYRVVGTGRVTKLLAPLID